MLDRLEEYLSHITGPRPTTLIDAPRLSAALGTHITIATETFQYTGSFKFRAAYNVASSIPHPALVTASSGNFGQAIALACRLVGKQCTVVMPDNSVQVKVDAVRAYGATADLIPTATVKREDRVAELAAKSREAYVASAYDDPLVIQGNASLGRELAHVAQDFDAVIVPVGGGGLVSGVITGLREAGSSVPVYAAEPLMGNDAAESFRRGELVVQDGEPQTLADGARTRSLGKHNWALLKDTLAGVLEVPEDAIVEGLRRFFLLANLKVEPTGALPLGALLAEPSRFAGQRVCLIASGGNVDPVLYQQLLVG